MNMFIDEIVKFCCEKPREFELAWVVFSVWVCFVILYAFTRGFKKCSGFLKFFGLNLMIVMCIAMGKLFWATFSGWELVTVPAMGLAIIAMHGSQIYIISSRERMLVAGEITTGILLVVLFAVGFNGWFFYWLFNLR